MGSLPSLIEKEVNQSGRTAISPGERSREIIGHTNQKKIKPRVGEREKEIMSSRCPGLNNKSQQRLGLIVRFWGEKTNHFSTKSGRDFSTFIAPFFCKE